MALTKEDLQAIGVLLDEKLEPIKSDIAEIKETVESHRDLTLEFYGKQMEKNTELNERIECLGTVVEIFKNQTIQNTAELKRIK